MARTNGSNNEWEKLASENVDLQNTEQEEPQHFLKLSKRRNQNQVNFQTIKSLLQFKIPFSVS